jgi:hypothetical protein
VCWAVKTGCCLLAAGCALVAGACAARSPRPTPVRWTAGQATSIRSIRGTPVRVRTCVPAGGLVRTSTGTYAARFRCVAAARLAHEDYDSVAVTFLLRPLERFRGPGSRYVLADVRFEALSVP